MGQEQSRQRRGPSGMNLQPGNFMILLTEGEQRTKRLTRAQCVEVLLGNGFDLDDIAMYFETEDHPMALYNKGFNKMASDVRVGRRVVAGLFDQGIVEDIPMMSIKGHDYFDAKALSQINNG
jgi:hypothetical protein